MPGIARGDELATVWQQWTTTDDLDLMFCAREGGPGHQQQGW